MTLHSSIAFFIAVFIFCITPGPGIFAILAQAMVRGAKSCLPLILGMVSADLVYLSFACLGLAAIAENFSSLFTVIRFVGAAYLIYLGIKMFKAPLPDTQNESEAEVNTKNHGVKNLAQGFLISASNPKVILFYIAFLPTFMDLTVLQANDIVLVNILAFFALMAGACSVAFSAEKAASVLKTPKAVRRLNRSAGGIMMGAGAFLAVKS